MELRSAVVNVLWGGSSAPSWERYRRALRAPAAAQERVLLSCLRRNGDTVVGRQHGFDSIRCIADYQARVPPVSYDEIATRRGRSGPPAAHITFDDGYAECHALAGPILLKRGIPCTFFVTTDLIDNRTMFHRNKASLCIEAALALSDLEVAVFLRDLGRHLGRPLADREAFRRWILALGSHEEACIDEVCSRLAIDVHAYLRERQPYLTTDAIRRLATDGFTIGAHARRHVPLGSLGEAAVEQEIISSCETIRKLTGRDHVPFAFPHSADGVDRSFLRRLVATHPILGLLFDTHRLRRDGSVILNRITADAPPASPQSTNLPQLLQTAYRDEATETLRRLISPGSRRQTSERNPSHTGQG